MSPTRPPHATSLPRRLLRWVLRIGVSLVLLWGVLLAALYGWAVPRLDAWRPALVAYLQQATGLQIDIATLHASRAANWLPALQAEGITVKDPQGHWQVQVPRAHATLSWQMLLGKNLGALTLEQPEVQLTPAPAVTQTTPPAAPSSAHSSAPQQALQWLLAQPSIQIEGGRLSWPSSHSDEDTANAESTDSAPTSPFWNVTGIDLQLRHNAVSDRHQLNIAFEAPSLLQAPAQLRVQGHHWQRLAQEGWRAWRTVDADWNADLTGLQLPPLAQAIGSIAGDAGWPPGVKEAMHGQLSLQAQGQFAQGEVRQARVTLNGQQSTWPAGNGMALALNEWEVSAAVQSHITAPTPTAATPTLQWQVTLHPLTLTAQDQHWQSEPMTLAWSTPLPGSLPHHTPEQHDSLPPDSLTTPLDWNDARLTTNSVDLGALSTTLQAAWVNAPTAHTAPTTTDATPPTIPAWQAAIGQLQQQLALWQPSGQLHQLDIGWQRPVPDGPQPLWPVRLSARLNDFSIGLTDAPNAPLAGLNHLSGDIQATPEGGKARLTLRDGELRLPTVMEPPSIPVDHLQASLEWTLDANGGATVQIHAPEVRNPHAQGSATVLWRTSTEEEMQALAQQSGHPVHPWPGFLDLQATLTRADARAVWRYLPHSIPADVRRYVQEAIQDGHSDRVQFDVRGSLKHFPFDPRQRDPVTKRYTPKTAEKATGRTAPTADATVSAPSTTDEVFRISADLADVDFRYAPHYLLSPGKPSLVWPDLQAVDGLLVFEGNRMDLTVAKGQLQAAPKVRITQGRAWIDDLMHAQVDVDVQATGPLPDQLTVLATTPVARMTGHLMDPLQGTGNSAFRLQLGIPLEKHAHDYRVNGEVRLQGNTLQWWPEVPELSDVRGLVTFTDKNFSVKRLQAQALGGPITLQAVMRDHVQGQPDQVAIDVQGRLTAQGLQQYGQTALTDATGNRLLSALTGETDYTLQIQTIGQRPYVSLSSSLEGLASALPYPLDKEQGTARPLTLTHTAPDPNGIEQLELQLNDRVYARYRLQGAAPATAAAAVEAPAPTASTTPAPTTGATAETTAAAAASVAPSPAAVSPSTSVLSGHLLIGEFSADERRLPSFIPNSFASTPVPTKVRATIVRPHWDAATWMPWLLPSDAPATIPQSPSPPSTTTSWVHDLIPDVWYGRFEELQWGALTLHDAQLQTYRNTSGKTIWTTHFKAAETQGTLEYHPDYLEETGLLRGKIDYLELPPQFGQTTASASTEEAEKAPTASEATETTTSTLANVQNLPTVDIEIGRLLFANRDWGQVALQAMNRVVDGQAREWKINYLTMETPEARLTAKGSWQDAQPQGSVSTLLSGHKRMDMQFTLEMFDAGRLLARMSIPQVLNAGAGKLNGRLSWFGSPLKLDIPSLHGDFHLDVEKGQFLKANAGAGRLLGVLSLQALPRRLSLDFRDIFSDGFAFDFVRGDVQLKAGQAFTNNLQMKGVNAGVVLEGSADIVAETQDIAVVVVPELDAMTASLVATAINPAIGAGTFLAQFFFSKPLAEAATQEFRIHGSWSDPIVERQEQATTTPPKNTDVDPFAAHGS